MRYQSYSFRFAEQVLNSKLNIKQEIEGVIKSLNPAYTSLSRPNFNQILDKEFKNLGWQAQPPIFDDPKDPTAKMDFLKDRVGIEVEFGHASFLGIDLLKFQIGSYSAKDKIDVGVFIVATNGFKKDMQAKYKQKWLGSLSYEKVIRYLPHMKSAIQVPVWVLGIEI